MHHREFFVTCPWSRSLIEDCTFERRVTWITVYSKAALFNAAAVASPAGFRV